VYKVVHFLITTTGRTLRADTVTNRQVCQKIGFAYSTPQPLNLEGLLCFSAILYNNIHMNILQEIFTDYYEEIKYILRPDDNVMQNIDKMINCGDPSYGGAMYCCPHCGNYKFVSFRCHSRFCPTCGNKYSMARSTNMAIKMINARHRHCVFTIDENLRVFFLNNHSLLNCLFHAVSSVVRRMFSKLGKYRNFTPGFIMVLHTFGRDLKWNPHIHCLITEGAFSDDGLWRQMTHFNYNYLRNAFRTALLNELEPLIGPSFKKTKALCYTNNKHGFYVYAKPAKCNTKVVVKYISRYLGRPVIATSRIDSYDGDNVTFHYNRHEDNVYVEETMPALDFISRLIRHIPDRHFKMIRYGGLYARHRESDKNLLPAIHKNSRPALRNFLKWKNAILIAFGYNPLLCPKCGHNMEIVNIIYNHHSVSLEEMFRKLMLSSRGRFSSA